MIYDMKSEDIVGVYRATTLHLFCGISRRVFYSDVETPCPDGRLIVSITDREGIITHVNKAFVDMSGYAEEELLGSPHAILRHPDMPAVAFKELWDTVSMGGRWQGYVKNLRKDGGYYWVKATVIPNIRNNQIVSYTSIRRKPSRTKVDECIEIYRALLAA